MVISAERRTCTTHAFVVYGNIISIHRSKNPLAGTGEHGTDRSIPCRDTPPFLIADKYAPLTQKAINPILCSAPGNAGRFLDIGYGKKALVLRKLPHQAQVIAPVFKYAGHTDPG
jgi:hypothetical protein